MAEIAEFQARAGDIGAAFATAKTNSTHPDYRAYTLGRIAEGQAKAGDAKAALATAQAVSVAGYLREGVGCHRGGPGHGAAMPGALATFAAAQTAAQAASPETNRSNALAAIAEAQAKAGDVGAALATAQAISYKWDLASSFRAIAESQAKAGDARAAFATAEAISFEWNRIQALGAVAEAQANSGDVPGGARPS